MNITWTASKLEHAVCDRLWFYENLYAGRREIPFNKPIVVGIFLHNMAEKFWVRDMKTGLIKPRYKSNETFVNAIRGRFKHDIINKGEIQEKRIQWKDEEEKWKALGEVINISRKFWDKSIDEYSRGYFPLLIEQPFMFRINGISFKGRIDDIRSDPSGKYLFIIRDHKSGRRYPRHMELEYKSQFTLYVLGIGCLVHEDKKFADILGISDEERMKLAGNPTYLDDRINVEYHHMRADMSEEWIFSTTRGDTHYHDFISMVTDIDERIRRRIEGKGVLYPSDFPPNRQHCDYCYASGICDAHTKGKMKPHMTLMDNNLDLQLESDGGLVVKDTELKTIRASKKPLKRKNRRQQTLDFEG